MSLNKLNILNKLLNFFNVKSYRQIKNHELEKIINLFKPYNVYIPLIRIGDDKDGGYLVPKILNNVEYCFSIGVGKSSSFEKNLEKYNIKSFLADKTVDKPAIKLSNYNFDKKNIHSYSKNEHININDWLLSKINNNNFHKSILQIDTDGFEYESILALDEKILSELQLIIIEFHGLELAGNENFNFILNSVLTKINLFHTSVHIHPNNCCGVHRVGKYNFPSVLEATFLNKKLINKKKPIDLLPHKLDKKNVDKKNDILLQDYWFK